MRLIDADALKPHEQLEPMGNGKYEYVEVVYKDDIDNAPTIDAVQTIELPMKRKEQLMVKYIDYEKFMELSPEHRKRVYELMIEINKANNSLIEAYRSGYTLLNEQNEMLERMVERLEKANSTYKKWR